MQKLEIGYTDTVESMVKARAEAVSRIVSRGVGLDPEDPESLNLLFENLGKTEEASGHGPVWKYYWKDQYIGGIWPHKLSEDSVMMKMKYEVRKEPIRI